MRFTWIGVILVGIVIAAAVSRMWGGGGPVVSKQPSESGDQISSFHQPSANITLRLAGVEPGKGPLMVAVFDSADGFPDHRQAMHRQSLDVGSFDGSMLLDPLSPGRYAIAVYQDVDANGEMNRALAGYPTEPYGFSNNARSMLGPPSFSSAEFDAIGGQIELEIAIK